MEPPPFTLWDYVSCNIKIELGEQNEDESCSVRSRAFSTEDYDQHFPSLISKSKDVDICLVTQKSMIKKTKRFYNNQVSVQECQVKDLHLLSKSQDNVTLEKVKGGARPAKVKIPKLRVLNPEENKNLQMFTNLIRPLFPYWHSYDSHEVCKFDQESCTFCEVRSLSLRMNGTKREPFIIPHEILSARNMKEMESFQLSVENMFTGMASSCGKFQENVGLKIQCVSCKTLSKIDNNPVLKCENVKENQNLSSILQRYMDNKISNIII